MLITEVITSRGAVTTYRAKKRSDNRNTVIKVIFPVESNTAFWKELNRMKECDSRFLIRYTECCENNKEYQV